MYRSIRSGFAPPVNPVRNIHSKESAGKSRVRKNTYPPRQDGSVTFCQVKPFRSAARRLRPESSVLFAIPISVIVLPWVLNTAVDPSEFPASTLAAGDQDNAPNADPGSAMKTPMDATTLMTTIARLIGRPR